MDVTAAIRRLVAAAPVLTTEQAANLAQALAPAVPARRSAGERRVRSAA